MIYKSKKILTEISAGELLDKISILEIKLSRIKNKSSQKQIRKEYRLLKTTKNLKIKPNKKITLLFKKVKQVNLNLWKIEDKIRVCEKNKNFGKTFITLARGVYFNNDKRAKIKSRINKILGSNIKEIKQYENY
tara:strand:- start:2429 stop:2830 length:402 start_codon:yes stop_codon:yes gene_type:complete